MSSFQRILDRPGTVAARRWLFQAHLWVGLAAGLVISILGLSGSMIVFRQEIYRRANTPLMRVEPTGAPRSLEEQADQVLGANPGAQIDFIELPRDAQETTRFSLRFQNGKETGDAAVYVNPYTAAVLSGNPRELRWLNWLVDLHHSLLAGRTGRLVEGVVAVLFLWLCISGIVIWWPGRPHWKRNLTINSQLRGWPLALGFHKAVGFWAVLILAMFAATGISFTWNVSKVVYFMTHSSPEKKARIESNWTSGEKLLPLDEYVARLDREVPQSEPVYMDLPYERNRLVRIGFRMPGDFEREGAVNSVLLDPATGAVLRVDLLRDEPAGERVLSSLGALHFGRFGIGSLGELPVKIVWVVMGLVPGALFYTGFLPWWNRVVRRRWAGRNA
jgi:uncharacterized iron-regulated membrane protein